MLCWQIVAMMTSVDVASLADREDGLLDDCLANLADSVQDPCYAARRHAALTVPALYAKLPDNAVSSRKMCALRRA